MRHFNTPAADGAGAFRHLVMLSARERQLLRLLVRARGDKQIAFDVALSVNTVKQYLARLRAGLKLQSRGELRVWTLQHWRALDGLAVEAGLHPDGCPCAEPFCMASRPRAILPNKEAA